MKSRKPLIYNVHQAKTQFSKLLERVANGEDIVIAEAGVPVARLVPIARSAEARVLGTERGRLILAEDFDAPLPKDVLESFES